MRTRASVWRRRPAPAATLLLIAAFAASATVGPVGSATGSTPEPTLIGRAVLPVATFADGPSAGNFVTDSPGTINGITFPLPGQPVQGFSAIIDGRQRGEYLSMPDNGFGGKANSKDFLIRAYHIRPDFKTADGGTGTVDVGPSISFPRPRPPHRVPHRERRPAGSSPHRW